MKPTPGDLVLCKFACDTYVYSKPPKFADNDDVIGEFYYDELACVMFIAKDQGSYPNWYLASPDGIIGWICIHKDEMIKVIS